MQKCQNAKSLGNQSTKCDITINDYQNRNGQKLKPFLTPYFSSKLKEIASKIRSNACKRFRTKDYDGQIKFILWSQFKQISDSSKDKSISTTKEDLTINQVQSLIKKERIKLYRLQSMILQKKKRMQIIISTFATELSLRKKTQREINEILARNKRKSLLLSYWKQLSFNKDRLQTICSQIKVKMEKTEEQMKRVKNCIQQIPKLDRLIAQKQQQYRKLCTKLVEHEQKVQKLINQRIPNQIQMINCIFYIGILSEQIHILVLQKKQKLIQKLTLNYDKAVNKSFKIHQKLARREIHIECSKSQNIEYKTFLGIYMHCKSLTISNIVTIMNGLSFFSDQFKQLYNYKLFQQYFSVLIEKLKLNTIKQVDYSTNNKQSQLLKRKLIIIVQPQRFPLIKWILNSYQIEDNTYSLYLGAFQMLIEIQAQSQEQQGQKQELILCEYNELKIHFITTVPPYMKLKSK